MLVITITREKLEAKRREAAAEGFNLVGDNGITPAYHNVQVEFDYSEKSGLLTLSVVKKPFIFPEATVENGIRQFFA